VVGQLTSAFVSERHHRHHDNMSGMRTKALSGDQEYWKTKHRVKENLINSTLVVFLFLLLLDFKNLNKVKSCSSHALSHKFDEKLVILLSFYFNSHKIRKKKKSRARLLLG
jgi:hypothetical protein